MLFDPTTLLLGCAALIVCAALVASFVRWPVWGIGLYIAVQLWQSQRDMPQPVRGAGVNLLPTDVLTVCLLFAALIMLGGNWGRRTLALLLALLVLTTHALIRGFGLFGIQTASNEARTSFIQLFCVALYVAVLPAGRKLLLAVTRIWMWAACALCCLALLWWLQVGIGSNSDSLTVDGVLTNARPLGADRALIIGQAAVILLCGRNIVWGRALAGTLLVVVILAQHRTVWLAVGVMITGWLLSRHRQTGSRAAALGVLGSLSTLYLLAVSWGTADEVTSSLAASSEDDRTLVWRMEGWHALLPQLDEVPDWLLGLPFGSGYDRVINGAFITVSPHNYYLEVLLRLGLLGVVVLLLVYATAWRAAGADSEHRLLLRLLICSQLVYMITYSLPPEQAVILGLLTACAQPRSARRPPTLQESPCPTKPRSSPASPARTARI
ncbi:O-antigen ligase family protein [Streptomyces sp. TRM68367]|uniref:O-antigen ligase family protein n=1 Tax=Streptomyces sp. TRM68367 TaxID=2758415 RepID=UPI00165ABD41|nr:O-antigen ligase family protein [Streptomyces sp. TRM68367]MBC9726981.1 O-antigen ligase family protein [Streptomyces sp. TRM68367]